jgi:tRNA 2-thiouridine synthesizing protein A
MKPGEELEVVAQSPGAPTDLPAWCRMTGHTLVSAQHPVYVIQRRDD